TRSSVHPPVLRFSFALAEGQQPILRMVALSPDGTHLVYGAEGRLYLRALSENVSKPIAGTDQSNATEPAFSPDGQSIVFASMADRTLKKVALSGGVPVTICPIDVRTSVTWSRDTILFSMPSGIMRVPAAGGSSESLVTLNAGERVHGPTMLPD